MSGKELIIYGCNFGAYDNPPEVANPIKQADYYMITEDKSKYGNCYPWKVVERPIAFGCPKRTSSIYKCDPTSLFGRSRVLWVDCNLSHRETFDYSVIESIRSKGKLVLGKHGERNKGVDELFDCVNNGYIDYSKMRGYCDFVKSNRWVEADNWLSKTSVIYRDLSDLNVVYAGRLWSVFCCFGPIRDQVSLPVSVNMVDCKYNLIDDFYAWEELYFKRKGHRDDRKSTGYGSYY